MRNPLFIFAVLTTLPVFAQAPQAPAKVPTDQSLVIGAAQLEAILKQPGDVSQSLFTGAPYSTSFIRLEQPDKPHIHPITEIYIMKEGSATLVTGGTMLGPFTSGGVHHQSEKKSDGPSIDYSKAPDRGGSAIEGGKTQQVTAGSVVVIPAGVAHTWVAIEKPIVYWDIKLPKAQ